MDLETLGAIRKILTENINPPILLIIIVLIYVEWKNFNNKGLIFLSLGWLFNLLYIFTESLTLTNNQGLLKLLFALAPLPVLLSNYFFFTYYLNIKKASWKIHSVLSLVFLLVFIFHSFIIFRYYNELNINPDHYYIPSHLYLMVYFPSTLITMIVLILTSLSIRTNFKSLKRGVRRILYLPYFAYGILQPIYLLIIDPDKFETYIILGFICGALIKVLIASSLLSLFFAQMKLFDREKAEIIKNQNELENREKQIVIFRWFAHELKNPILVIRNIAGTINNNLRESKFSSAHNNISSLYKAVDVLSSVVENVKLAAEPIDRDHIEPIQVNEVIQESLKIIMLTYSLAGKQISTDFASDLFVKANKENLIQIFVNLLKNAYEASTENEELILSTSSTFVKVLVKTRKTVENDKTYVSIKVSDFGPGIPNNILNNIFEPYFSTKKGSNRGMGLYISDRFIKEFGGKLIVTSPIFANSYGTMFEILFPFVPKQDPTIENK